MPSNPSIFLPVVALAAWTFIVLLAMPLVRGRAVRRGDVALDDFAYGESASVPPRVGLPNRNLMNLLELPVLFYVACIVLHATGGAGYVAIALAWLYVALRIAHSTIHLTYNRVAHRGLVFAASNAALVALWVVLGVHVVAAASIPR